MPQATDQAEQTPTPAPEDQSSSDKSLTGATPTPQQGEETPTVAPGEEDQEASGETAETQAEGQAAPAQEQKPAKAPWFQKRIDQLVWEKNEERRAAAAKDDQIKQLLTQLEGVRNGATVQAPVAPVEGQQPPAPAQGQQPPAPAQRPAVNMSEAEIEARAVVKAQAIAAKQSFDKACNAIAMQGKEAYNDFDSALRTFELLGGIPQPMLEAITDMPNAHKVLYAIGKDPELADKITKLPVARMGLELARVEGSLKAAPKTVSGTRTPITPIDTTASGQADPEKMSTQEWIKWREKTKKTRW